MVPFNYMKATSARAASAAVAAAMDAAEPGALAQGRAPMEFLAGGTTLLDLMKLQVMRPDLLIDLNGIRGTSSGIDVTTAGLRLGAMATMADVASHTEIAKAYPVLTQSLLLAASAQLRNMATLGGNVLQRTRCSYFRDVDWSACNKRNPGSGCAALDGVNRSHAVLGASDQCIATYPGDWAQALMVLDAGVEILGTGGVRAIPFRDLHKPPGQTPHVETSLAAGDLITAFTIPAGPAAKRSLYLKVRDRQSYEFALASAAVAIHVVDGKVAEARIALGGVATRPWRAGEAEASLIGKPLDESAAQGAGHLAFADARAREHNGFKIALGRETVARALIQAAAMEA